MTGRFRLHRPRRVPRRLAALLLGLSLLLVPDPAAARALARDADPALWVVRDADTTLYLFGTVHFLPRDLAWFDEPVARALQASDELKLEILPQDNPAALAPQLIGLALDPTGRTMAQRLSPKEHAAYVQGLTRLGLPAAALEPLEPWFISVAVAVLLYSRAGLDPNAGSEAVLAAAARQAGKTITAFETAQEQFAILESAPEVEQLTSLRDLLDRPDQAVDLTRRILEHWARGEVEETGRLLHQSLRATPATARLLLRERNVRWAAALRQRLARPGVVFVAVGAGHLAGADSVQEQLRRAGLVVQRIR